MVAAGNSGGQITHAPSNALIVASATDSNDKLASWCATASVDVSAPGASIYTTTRGGGYSSVSGTSFSSPIVAATAALLFSTDPNLAPGDVDQILTNSTQDLGEPGYDQYFGHGRLNAGGAVQNTYARLNVDYVAPTISITSPLAERYPVTCWWMSIILITKVLYGLSCSSMVKSHC